MPGVSLHFVLADHALHAWRSHDLDPPFDPDDPTARNAFHHGALGPDLGYFPGGDRALSDLAHCLAPARLARALVRSARTVRERAFAWGWVSHVLADQAIHPWIGRGVGALLHGDPTRFVDGSSDLHAHLRVEMGLDAWYAARRPEVRPRRLTPVFDATSVGFLSRAYAATYGVPFDSEPFLRSHRAVGRRAGQALATVGLVHALLDDGTDLPGVPRLRRALEAAWHSGRLRNAALSYLTPVRPAPWLIDAVDREVARHARYVLDAWESDGASVDDRNLDTGRPLAVEVGHSGTRRALAAVRARARLLRPAAVRVRPAGGTAARVSAGAGA